jgi:hypothetical protein
MKVLMIIFFIFLVIIAFMVEKDCPKYIYNCMDINGNSIVCENIRQGYGGILGYMEDGTVIQLKSYRAVVVRGE